MFQEIITLTLFVHFSRPQKQGGIKCYFFESMKKRSYFFFINCSTPQSILIDSKFSASLVLNDKLVESYKTFKSHVTASRTCCKSSCGWLFVVGYRVHRWWWEVVATLHSLNYGMLNRILQSFQNKIFNSIMILGYNGTPTDSRLL